LQVAALGVIALLIGLLAWRLADRDAARGVAAAVEQGKAPPAPDFTIEELDGTGKLRLSSFAGKVVVINFWASWCLPCRDEAPHLQSAWERWGDRGVVVLGVNAQDFISDAREFVEEFGLTYPNGHDGPGTTLGSFGVTGFPETWFASPDGRLVGERIQGPVTTEDLDRNIAVALGEGAAAVDPAAGESP
jgi:cytochrome c biogenesis protein CcmG/thiol:disulfide interchange protein DsbE